MKWKEEKIKPKIEVIKWWLSLSSGCDENLKKESAIMLTALFSIILVEEKNKYKKDEWIVKKNLLGFLVIKDIKRRGKRL